MNFTKTCFRSGLINEPDTFSYPKNYIQTCLIIKLNNAYINSRWYIPKSHQPIV
jgi:hypothetical protein